VAPWTVDTTFDTTHGQIQKNQCPQRRDFGVDTREHKGPESHRAILEKSTYPKDPILKRSNSH
jgi:hypothetical protein